MMFRRERGPRKGGLIRKGVRSLAGGIGLASESVKAYKEGDSAKAENPQSGTTSRSQSDATQAAVHDVQPPDAPPPSYSVGTHGDTGPGAFPAEKVGAGQPFKSDGSIEAEDIENEWDLDDIQDQIVAQSSEPTPNNSEAEEDIFLRSFAPSKNVKYAATGNLSLPVILPQRRPKDRSRGFIRAYAPVLADCDIDQPTWLAFLDSFQKSSAANPWLNAINLARFATFAIPFGAGIAVSYAIKQIVNATIELQGRGRTNMFLYKINEEFFRPRGLYCLIMTYNPESTLKVESVNLTATIASRSNASEGSSNYRSSDGNTFGDFEFPQVSPLIFPALDQLATATSTAGVKEKTNMAKRMGFVANYWDKRATAEYAMSNPNSLLAQVPQEKFNSRYADPANPAARGSLISLVSGGHLVPNPGSRGLVGGLVNVVGQAVRGEEQGSGWKRYEQQGIDPDRNLVGRAGLISTPIGAAKRLVKQNVLYLMVVNMPTEQEMAAAQSQMQ